MTFQEKYERWLASPAVDEATKAELRAADDIEERFYKDLEFGTGGLRGILGAGTNRMNSYTVRQATQGLASYICDMGPEATARGVVISYDSRHRSAEFAMESARVLAANGVKAYVFDALRPTPELSFSVRELGAFAGIMITASHNPAKYNGYKVYGEDGAQLTAGADTVIRYVNNCDIFDDVKVISEEEGKAKGLIQMVGAELDEAFYAAVLAQSILPDLDRDSLKIVYTPFHGTGYKPVTEVLSRAGFHHVTVVPEQALPDPDFSTVKSPNPEEKEGFARAIEIAKEQDADIIIGTDPDADRIGVVAKNADGEYQVFTGNQTGVLLTEYILSQKKAAGKLHPGDYVVSTIVSTKMGQQVAKRYGADFYEVFTGFKFIAAVIAEMEQKQAGNYLFGFEESYGYLPGTYARDKDAVAAALLVCELAAFYKQQGMGFAEALDSLYQTYGYYTEKLVSVVMEGKDGMEKMAAIMASIAANPPKQLGGVRVVALRDYNKELRYDFAAGTTAPLALGKSNVLYFELENDWFFVIRPSGTEPKIKLYFGVVGDSSADGMAKIAALETEVRNLLV